ncbi:MAG TPA: transposase [Thermoanaerobaculia bacterium]|jgi:REP element-mobilizing transposase RayT|nr:transposase [Thermoanaerobaculia bacterium]
MGDLLYRKRYRIPSTRLSGWDYGLGGAYCITICTLNRICCFGEVLEGRMVPSGLGQIVAEEWEEMARRRPYVDLDAWVVMPNHFHGILFVHPPPFGSRLRTLGTMIGQFKGACSRRIWAGGSHDFDWQERFFDQIIRDEATLLRFRKYILENPLRWEKDKHHPKADR